MNVKISNPFKFDTRSLALFASLALGSGLAAAQFTVGPSAPAKPATAAAPSPGSDTSQAAAPAADPFRKADANGDGNISRAEAGRQGGLAGNFDKLDTSRDGVLSRAEFNPSLK